MKWLDYREKLGIGFNETEKLLAFKNKVVVFLTKLIDRLTETSLKEYCIMVGEKPEYINILNAMTYSFEQSKSIAEIIAKYIAFCNTFYEFGSDRRLNVKATHSSRQKLLIFLENCLTDLNIPYEILKDSDGVFVFPKGAKELDDALVSEVLEWLNEYPDTKIEWVQALRDYSSVTEENASDVADKFRKALERFFQEFFGKKDKNLENLKSDYGKFMESKGVPPELSNNFQNLLEAYTKFMNNHAKHQNKTSKNTLEYIMYQTGNIIRFLITLNK